MKKTKNMSHLDITQHRFLILFISLILLIFISPYLIDTYYGQWILGFSTTLVLIALVFSTVHRTHYFILSCIQTLIILFLQFYSLSHSSETLLVVISLLSALLYLFAIMAVFTEIFTSDTITSETILGALSIYMFLAIIYSNIYQAMETLAPHSFSFGHASLEQLSMDNFNLLYFSFTTLTTVGFGDILATSPHAKAIVMLEEITGVLYLAVLVAHLVSGFSRKQQPLT